MAANSNPGDVLSLTGLADDMTLRPSVDEQGRGQAPRRDAASRYRAVRLHAKGGIGEVHLAHDDELHRDVALKRIQDHFADHGECRRRFLLEAEITARLQHPGIVPVYGLVDDEQGQPCYAMRFIEGQSLDEAIGAFHGRREENSDVRSQKAIRNPQLFVSLEFRKLLGRFVDACNAVAYAHSRGVMHRDLKPGNIMLGPYGETLVVDWGLAKVLAGTDPPGGGAGVSPPLDQPNDAALGSDLPNNATPCYEADTAAGTRMGAVVGTPQYMSPEQAEGRHDLVGPASDVYSLGATLYTLLTGKPPIPSGEVRDVISRVARGEFSPSRQINMKVPAPLDAICRKAMALDPNHRYASARALADDVEHWLADVPLAAYREPFARRFARWVRKHKGTAGAVAAAVGVLVIGGLVAWAIGHRANERTRVLARVDTLLNATSTQVPRLLEELAPFREIVQTRLASVCATAAKGSTQRLHASLALLAADSRQVDYLRGQLLVVAPGDFFLVREALVPYQKILVGPLWTMATNAQHDPPQRFQAACALAMYAPHDERWSRIDTFVAGRLVTLEASDLVAFREALRPARRQLVDSLAGIYRGTVQREQARTYAAETLADYASDAPDTLFDLLADAEPFQFAVVYNKLKDHDQRAIELGAAELVRKPAADAAEDARERLGTRQANAAVALVRLGAADQAWPLLKASPDPRARSYLIHALAPLVGDPQSVIEQLDDEREPDVTIRRALLLTLGEFDDARFPPSQRRQVIERLLGVFENEPDAGQHAAAEWLLRKWGQDQELKAILERLRTNEEQLQDVHANGNRHWYTNTQGQTFVILPPGEFQMGSPPWEPGRYPDETQHRRKIEHHVAIAAHQVTRGQWRRFQHEHPEMGPRTAEAAETDDSPQIAMTW
ncbi:MAG TPA: protein kinase, partial [Pirellulales bacterium]|nr:protein kinase [Pirellulales bacterium]